MKCIFAGLWMFVLLGLTFSAPFAPAERPSTPQRTYNITKEVTLAGRVSRVLAAPQPGMLSGSHLILSVGAGTVDASLGRFALQGRDALSVEEGREIEITGILHAFHEKQVMLVRTVKFEGRTYVIRNEHGVPVSPQSRLWAEKREAR